jgi:hypothetical protein
MLGIARRSLAVDLPPRMCAMRNAHLVTVAAILLTACTGAPAGSGTGSTSLGSLEASATPDQSGQSASPSPFSTPRSEQTKIAGNLVLRVDSIDPEMGPDYAIPLLSVYEDGSVIQVVDDPETDYDYARYARLTGVGLETVLAEAGGATILETGDPAGDRLASLDTWLTASAWDVPPDDHITWVPARYMLAIRVYEEPRSWPIDIDDVWPLSEAIATFGEPFAGDEPAPGDRQLRCGLVTLDEGLALQSGISEIDRGGIPREIATWVELDWEREAAWVALVLEALMPDEPLSCEMLRGYPG